MNPAWKTYLQSRNAAIQDDQVVHYGNAAAELASVSSGTVIVDLSHFGLIGFSGEDAQVFPPRTTELRRKTDETLCCCPRELLQSQGQNVGEFFAVARQRRIRHAIAAALQPVIQKRLSMYVLRAKVKLTDISDTLIRIGIAGSKADALIGEVLERVPDHDLGMIHTVKAEACFASGRIVLN